MTFKEENIVNIAMRAGELLKEGRIERDDITGHAGLTDTILHLADAFEKKYAGVDFNAGDRDYTEEIDAFAEEQLIQEYGIDQPQGKKPLDIKMVIEDGCVSAVLKSQDLPVNLEVVEIVRDLEDYPALAAYRDTLYADSSLQDCEFNILRFLDDAPEPGISQDVELAPVTIFAHSGGGTSFALMSGNYDVCLAFCQHNNWEYVEENHFVWDLTLEDEREENFPVGFEASVREYSREEGTDIDCEFVRQNADKLVEAQLSGLTFSDFKAWAQLEKALGEKIELPEFCELKKDDTFASMSPSEYSSFSENLKALLAEQRDFTVSKPFKSSLNDMISKASLKQSSQAAPSQSKDYSRDI